MSRRNNANDEDEVEKFEITDYDLDNEFNPFRQRKRPTKQQQIYGVWADDDDDSEDDGRLRRQRRNATNKRQATKPQNYTAPIGFVAGGVQQAGKNNKKKNHDGSDNINDDDDGGGSDDGSEDDENADKSTKTFRIKNSTSESSEDESTARTGFGGIKQHNTMQATVTEITGEIAGLRTKNYHSSNSRARGGDGVVGNWEKHTKGIGVKLLLQMGFEPGKGLGKDLQGISAPVEAHLRKGRGAIGAYGPEKPASIANSDKKKSIGDVTRDSTGADSRFDAEIEGESKWKKKSNDLQKKSRYYYRSVDDVIEKGKQRSSSGAYRNLGAISELGKVKVIDMTGPQQRILSGYHALSGLKAPPGVEHYEDVVHKKCSNFTLPEIQHNLDLLVDICEQDIIRIDRNTRLNQDRIVALKQEQQVLVNGFAKEEELIDHLKSVMEIVQQLLDPMQDLSLGQVAQIFRDLQDNYFDEYMRYELGELAPGLVGPLLTSALASWSPLVNPVQHFDMFQYWMDILDVRPKQRGGTLEGVGGGGGNNMGLLQPYDSLLWHTWMPVFRRICVSTWNPKDCDSLITLIETWMPLLPQWILDNIYDQLVMPRIQTEVNNWNPLTDTVPIHTWIHPWIPLLDTRLESTIYPIIKEKLGTALNNWHPSDRSAKLMLEPWQRVLPQGSFVAFLIKHIVPKLQMCMQSLVINPHQQHLDAWNWVMDWNDMLSVGNMTLILDKFFFPRWRQTLAVWLNHQPDYTQVTEWYSGWKSMLSDELLAQPTIKDNFHNALEIMNRAVNIGTKQPGAKESISYLTSMETNAQPAPPPPPPSSSRVESFAETVRTVSSKMPPSLLYKDLVAKRCEERGILFVPIPNKYHEAKQVYRIGTNGVQCYIDRNVVFSSSSQQQQQQNTSSVWVPTSLTRLLDMS